ncbi:MAG TPA: sigma-70 family RNA polymerase sigma factor [Verrucomicrobiae bacterium]|nr:sigma-70 family RNA polymerase sigma factor [Verrucomicrobiae bacterium]
MIATRLTPMHASAQTDAELVTETLSGNRDAFAQIVARYQTLVCGLTYSACGNFQVSEDLAQVTFITAWCELAKLKEPSKLKSWLCGIARNVTNNSRRRDAHAPTTQAESLDNRADAAIEPTTPRDHAISREEEAILWHSLSELPPIYREPLVLFYRHHQSVAAVAEALDLSEDVVKQRLSRGRAMLAERVNRIVESTLSDSGPTPAFTAGVLAALPLAAATSSTIASVGATAKSAGWLAALGAILTAGLLLLFSVIAFLLFTGACVGYVMSRAAKRSARQRQNVVRFWRTVSVGFLVFVLPAGYYGFGFKNGIPAWLGLWLRPMYPLVLVALAIWAFRWWRDSFGRRTEAAAPVTTSSRSFLGWLALGMVIPTFLSALLIIALFQGPLTCQRLSGEQAQKIIAERSDAQITLGQYKGVPRIILIRLPETWRTVEFWVRADEPTLSALTKSGRKYRPFEYNDTDAPLSMRWLPVLSLFLAPIGFVLLLGRPWRYQPDRPEINAPATERVAAKSFVVCLAFALVAIAVFLGLITRWQIRFVSTAEAQQIALQHPDARIEIAQYKNGFRELHVTLAGDRRPPIFIGPADESTLALLAEHHISYRTYIQGVDFGFAELIPSHSLVIIILLAAGAALLVWWVVRKPPVSSPAST